MLSRIHDVPVDLRSSHEAETEEDTFTMVRTLIMLVKALIYQHYVNDVVNVGLQLMLIVC